MDLKTYFDTHTVNKSKWCLKHKISRQTITNILGGYVPSLTIAMKIYRATNRQVQPKDLGVDL